MRVPLLQIDAFADRLLEGNPAAVMPLPRWLGDAVLQRVAAENNLSETAFVVPGVPADAASGAYAAAEGPAYHLRWFTPTIEIDLCGHATLATAAHLLEDVHPAASQVRFWTRSGWLAVERADGGGYTLDFPSELSLPVAVEPAFERALGVEVVEAFLATDLICVLDGAETVRALAPDIAALAAFDVRGVVATAAGAGTSYDFVSRFFGPRAGVPEDPVTGSAHSQLAPLWAERLGKTVLVARQLSARGGTVRCRVAGERTYLTGRCERFLEGVATVPEQWPA